MKILCVVPRYHPVIGGSELLAKNLMDYLSKKHEITVYTTTANSMESFWNKNEPRIKDDIFEKYPVKRYDFLTPTELVYNEQSTFVLNSNYPGPFSPKMWNDLLSNKIDYDLIIAIGFPYDHIIPAYVAAKKWKIPIIIIPLIHQEFPELYCTAMRLTMLANSDCIFVLSESEKRKLTEFGVDGKKIMLLSVPLYLNEWKDRFPMKLRKSLSIEEDRRIILFVGSKSKVKGVIFLIDAMKLVWKKYDPILILIGPTTREFESYFSKLNNNIKEKIIDLGEVSEETKKNAFAACDMVILPSKSESFGRVYLEAWICQRPVIGCDIDSTSELIDNMKNGVLVQFGNITQLSESIIYLLNNPSICEKFGKDGYQKSLLYDSEKALSNFEKKCVSVVNDFSSK